MPRGLDLNTKLRLNVEDAAYALSISKEKAVWLLNKKVIKSLGGKVLTEDLRKLTKRIYHPEFPNNIENTIHRKALIEVFCNSKEKFNYLKNI